ncbi:glycogen synthase GlgA [Anaerotruncus sp. AF02-27]|uniref:glycogen synthase GlgA n=1 Tax=Anaerotruncus sp. AF02-27 TaxID=2292191 RepID=UPI000E4683A5|nr:glycogen synthase GlgA [Anaerotruncus sp. AF02-27]RGX52707.1 glycogen synthase GlgA [Anaerotruncus sp. AF02-27]
MKILYVASEATPFIATGGLADVAGSLPRAIRSRQHACRVVVPLYSAIKPEWREKMKFLCNFYVPLGWRNQYCGVFEASYNGVKYYFIDNEYYFKRDGGIYGFYDDAERFAFFSKAVCEMIQYIDFEPDILHCNDWQTAMTPVYLNIFYREIEKYRSIKTVFTIHNIQYQGKYGMEIATDVLGLPYYAAPTMMYEGCLNMMKAAIEVCDFVTTVSPTYAHEITDPWFAHGLDRLLKQNQHKLVGILNGIDTQSYNPEVDPALYENYGPETLDKKSVNKVELQKAMGLEQNKDVMLVGIVTRFVAHKGIDLIQYIFDELMKRELQVVALGSGDYIFESFFTEMQAKYPGKAAVKIGFIPDLARKIYAGADVFLMPSKSEPCGLAQMVSLQYGTLPVVRETGGLKDSIVDMGNDISGNGFTFKTYNAHDMLGAIDRAGGLYYNRELWKQAVQKAMKSDFTWNRSASEYIGVYKRALED